MAFDDAIYTGGKGFSHPSRIAIGQPVKMYWIDEGTNKIRRANLDGSQVEDVLARLPDPYGIAMDVAAGKIYWTDRETDRIQRANLDGSEVEDIVTSGLEGPTGTALDVTAGKIYWTDIYSEKIQRANLDGSEVEVLVTSGLDYPYGIALDVVAGKMYWTDRGTGQDPARQPRRLRGRSPRYFRTEISLRHSPGRSREQDVLDRRRHG